MFSGPPASHATSRASTRCASVTLELHRHEVVGLIGPNGAGKTTLVNVLSGFDFPTRARSSSRPRRHAVDRRTGAAARASHGRSSTRGRSRRSRVRENVEVAALGVGRAAARGAAAGGAAPRARRARPLRRAAGREPRARRRAQARRRPGARDRAALPAARRAGRRAARGRSARVRRRRPLGARRARGGRAPDRPQHGARDGGLRPDPGARPGTDARRGNARRGAGRTSTSPPPTSARRRCPTDVGARRRRGALRLRAGRARLCRSRRRGRDRRPDRPERRRQVDDPARDHGRSSRPTRGDVLRGRVDPRPARRRRSPAPGSRSCPRAGGSTPNLTVEENLRLGFAGRRTRERRRRRRRLGARALPDRRRVRAAARRARSPAASSSSWRSPARSSPAPTCCSSTSRRSAWRRQLVDTVFEALGEIRERGVTVLLVEQRAQRTVAFADRTYVLANGELVATLGAQGRLRHRAADRRLPRPMNTLSRP